MRPGKQERIMESHSMISFWRSFVDCVKLTVSWNICIVFLNATPEMDWFNRSSMVVASGMEMNADNTYKML
jgi:hypothetical protein